MVHFRFYFYETLALKRGSALDHFHAEKSGAFKKLGDILPCWNLKKFLQIFWEFLQRSGALGLMLWPSTVDRVAPLSWRGLFERMYNGKKHQLNTKLKAVRASTGVRTKSQWQPETDQGRHSCSIKLQKKTKKDRVPICI